MTSEFIDVKELSQLTGMSVRSLYNQKSLGRGSLASILTKLGSRFGCWRADWEALKAQQRKLKAPADADRSSAAG